MPNGDARFVEQYSSETMTASEPAVDGDTMEKDESTSAAEGTNEGVSAMEAEARRREFSRVLEAKPHCSHLVHCPLFPLVSALLFQSQRFLALLWI